MCARWEGILSTNVLSFQSGDEPLYELHSPDAKRVIRDLSTKIIEGYTRGRYPLFFIGAGVSRAARVPMMSDMLMHLLGLVKKIERPKLPTEIQSFSELLEYCSQATRTNSRSDISVLFGALQDSTSSSNRALWNQFCSDFVSGRIPISNDLPSNQFLLDLEPTDSHKWIARMCADFRARCVSLNFDGLTRKALDQELEKRKEKAKAVILDSSEKIQRFYGRAPEREGENGLRGIIKLRGDVFYAVCQTSGCPLERERIPIYEMRKGVMDPEVDVLLKCPECHSARGLQISFPGLHLKELESEDILADLWSFVAPSTSAVIVMGFSGEWDQSAVEFLLKAAQSQKIVIVDVRLRPDPDGTHYLRDIWHHKYGRSPNYSALYGACDTFTKSIETVMSQFVPEMDKSSPKLKGIRNIPSDLIWNKDKEEVSSLVSAHICRLPEVEKLKFYSQLGLKTYWWGVVKEFANHNRYLHSIGAMRVADKWYDTIGNCIPHQKGSSKECERELLRVSMLLHDYGHLPFSHLFEEIFDELNWLPSPETQRPWHEVLTREKIDILFKARLVDEDTTVNQCLARAGLSQTDVLQLIDGCSGRPYLDAIVNSPIDADKIDYIFRDLSFINKFHDDPKYMRPGGLSPLDPNGWLEEFLEEQEVSPEGYIRLNGRSAMKAIELLDTRRNLYLDFYIAPELRVMERITAFILVTHLTHFLTADLRESITGNDQFDYDHGTHKVHLASKRVLEKYQGCLENQSYFREGALLQGLLDELIAHRNEMDEVLIEVMKAFDSLLKGFFKVSDETHFGHYLHRLYGELLVAGPYYTSASNEKSLREIVRELTLLHQGTVLFDVVKTPKFLGGASSRDFSAFWNKGTPGRPHPVGEVYFVPSTNPSEWKVKSKARVPLSAVDFGALGHRYLQIVVFDPLQKPAKAKFVAQQFQRMCTQRNIKLVENPKICT